MLPTGSGAKIEFRNRGKPVNINQGRKTVSSWAYGFGTLYPAGSSQTLGSRFRAGYPARLYFYRSNGVRRSVYCTDTTRYALSNPQRPQGKPRDSLVCLIMCISIGYQIIIRYNLRRTYGTERERERKTCSNYDLRTRRCAALISYYRNCGRTIQLLYQMPLKRLFAGNGILEIASSSDIATWINASH